MPISSPRLIEPEKKRVSEGRISGRKKLTGVWHCRLPYLKGKAEESFFLGGDVVA